MAMHPHNYKDIERSFNKLVPKVERILSPNTPITFLDENIDTLRENSALTQRIEIAYDNLEKDSARRPTYEYMLKASTYFENKLSNYVKALY